MVLTFNVNFKFFKLIYPLWVGSWASHSQLTLANFWPMLSLSRKQLTDLYAKYKRWHPAGVYTKLTKSPGLERDVPVSRKGMFGTHLCPGLQKAVPVGTEGITFDNWMDSSRFSMQLPELFTRPGEVNTCLHWLRVPQRIEFRLAVQWRRKYFWKEGAEEIRRKAPKYCLLPPWKCCGGGADFRVGLV